MKREGLKSGVPDICLPIPKGQYCGLYIELKVGKNKPTKNQEYWLFSLSKAGHRTAVCYTREQVQKEILSYLALKDTSE